MCGIIALIGSHTSKDLLDRLKLLQHRGTESYGYYCTDFNGEATNILKAGQIEGIIKTHDISAALGHTRYSTSGRKREDTDIAQPMQGNGFHLVHNGNIPHHRELAQKLGISLSTDSDTELIVNYINKKLESVSMETALISLLDDIKGAYCLLIQTPATKTRPEGIYAVRDRFGVRPLCVGRSERGYCYASESVSLVDNYVLGEVLRGSVVFCDGKSQRILHKLCGTGPARQCTFEDIYFKQHRSYNVYNKRFQMGYELGMLEIARTFENQRQNALAQVVVCLPNTAISCAEGFSEATGVQFKKDWIQKWKNDRTFILPDNYLRISACRKAFMIDKAIEGKDIYLLDDSIVRGNTMTAIIEQLRQNGVGKIHVRICSPPIVETCQYGIDIPSRTELIAHGRTVREICSIIGADSLTYLPRSTVEDVSCRGCTQCFGGDLLW